MNDITREIDTYLPIRELREMDPAEQETLIRAVSRLIPASVEAGQDMIQIVTNPLAETEGKMIVSDERLRLILAVRGMIDRVYESKFCPDVMPYAHATEFTNGFYALELDSRPCDILPSGIMSSLFTYVEHYMDREKNGRVSDFETFVVSFTDYDCLSPSFEDTLREFVERRGYYFSAGQFELSYMHPGQQALNDERKMFTPVLMLKKKIDKQKMHAFGDDPARCSVTNKPIYRTVGAREITSSTDGVYTEVGLLSAEVFQRYRTLRQDPRFAKVRKPKGLLEELRSNV